MPLVHSHKPAVLSGPLYKAPTSGEIHNETSLSMQRQPPQLRTSSANDASSDLLVDEHRDNRPFPQLSATETPRPDVSSPRPQARSPVEAIHKAPISGGIHNEESPSTHPRALETSASPANDALSDPGNLDIFINPDLLSPSPSADLSLSDSSVSLPVPSAIDRSTQTEELRLTPVRGQSNVLASWAFLYPRSPLK